MAPALLVWSTSNWHQESARVDGGSGKGDRATLHGRRGVGVAARQTVLLAPNICCCLSRKEPAARKPATALRLTPLRKSSARNLRALRKSQVAWRSQAQSEPRRQPRKDVVLLSGNVLPLSKDCDTRGAKRRGAKRRRCDDESQWGIRSNVNCPEYKAKELTARDGSEMCECGVSLDNWKCK